MKKYNFKRIGALLLAAVMLCTVLAGCGGGKHDTESPSKTDDLREINVVLDWYPNALHTFLYVAIERGYFAEEGLSMFQRFGSTSGPWLRKRFHAHRIAKFFPEKIIDAKNFLFFLPCAVIKPIFGNIQQTDIRFREFHSVFSRNTNRCPAGFYAGHFCTV